MGCNTGAGVGGKPWCWSCWAGGWDWGWMDGWMEWMEAAETRFGDTDTVYHIVGIVRRYDPHSLRSKY